MSVHEDPPTSAFFHNSLSVIVGDGKSVLFWMDRWLDGKGVADLVPNLVATVPQRWRNSSTVACALPNNAWIRGMTSALTISVLLQYLGLCLWLPKWALHPDVLDRFVWKWCPSGSYPTRQA
jgi:hypothetical protein